MTTIRTALIGAVAAALLAPGASRGHEDGVDARGTVAQVSADDIVVTTRAGERKQFAVTGRTKVLRGSEPVTIGAVQVGERAVVHGRKADGRIEAASIRLARSPSGK
jgi:hypothetical protein